MIELKGEKGMLVKIRDSEIAAVSLNPGFDLELSTAICHGALIMKSGMLIVVNDTKAKIEAAIRAVREER